MERIVSAQEFADKAEEFSRQRSQRMNETMPPRIVSLAEKTRKEVRRNLKLKDRDIVIVLGEQAYGLNEPPKVLGKRLMGKHLEKRHGTVSVELFACNDIVGSEAGIYRMNLPQPNKPEGSVAVNTLPGWKHAKNRAIIGFRPPSKEDLAQMFATITTLYGQTKAANLQHLYESRLESAPNYAAGNIALLRELEAQTGLGIKRAVGEDVLDTKIAQSGGMELMLYLWPKLVDMAKQYPTEGVRVPSIEETPFYLYHQLNGCMGRINAVFDIRKEMIGMETPINCTCLQCGGTERTTCASVLQSGRTLTWRAIPRVVIYSTVFDGHVTGGGSFYNNTAAPAAEKAGIPYFPITNMQPEFEGQKVGIFEYSSSAVNGKGPHRESALSFVQRGRAAITDLLLSIGTDQLKHVIGETLNSQLNTRTRVICPPPLPKNKEVIRI